VTRLAGRIYKEFGVKLSLGLLFRRSVLSDQCRLIEESRRCQFLRIEPIPGAESYALSPMQRSLWILSKFKGGDIAYTITRMYTVEGNMNREGFAYSFQQLVKRHEILRTSFRENERSEVRQCIRSTAEGCLEIQFFNLRQKSTGRLSPDKILQAESLRPFDLLEGPLLRICLIQTGDYQWALVLAIHHIISDGWSMQVLLNDVVRLYKKYINDDESPLPELRIQYKDFAAWQNRLLGEEESDRHRRYWSKKLSSPPPIASIPTDFARPNRKTYYGDVLHGFIENKNIDLLKSIAHDNGMSIYMMLVGFIEILIYKYTEQKDIIIGCPVAGRDHPDLEDQIGFYTNTLALRVEIMDSDNIDDVLKKVKVSVLEAFEHSAYPFSLVVEETCASRGAAGNPLFEIMAVLQNVGEIQDNTVYADDELHIRAAEAVALTSRFDLNFNMQETLRGLNIALEFNIDLYERSSMALLMDRFSRLIRMGCENRHLSIGSIALDPVYSDEE
jgi:NRPS condensation-like uncharacterized protein